MQVTVKYQTLPGIIWTVIPRAWEKKDIVLQLLMNFVGYKVSINTLVNMQGSHEKMCGGNILLIRKKNISQAIEIKCKILFSGHMKKRRNGYYTGLLI